MDSKKNYEIVYIGITNNPEQREEQHKKDKEFDKLRVVSDRPMTEKKAKKEEAKRLATYRQNHQGKNPKYNKDDDG